MTGDKNVSIHITRSAGWPRRKGPAILATSPAPVIGANLLKVYDGARILPAEPTRLFVDAKDSAEWRGKGFHPVL